MNDGSKTRILNAFLTQPPFDGANCTLMLFDTLVALAHDTSYAALTAHEAAFSGYARQVVTGWGSSVLTADFHARSQAGTVTFDNSGGSPSSTLTGWALIDEANSAVIMAGLYDAPFAIPDGQSYLTTPFFLYTGEIGSEP